ncbi:pentapeptide repeat-containing protein [Nocardioides sp. zg-1228]|uniref:pentapeptide repeat-containing protein n=1 Tax=Nocardioides sp. zg-1228 TaxID=2763008 RepID=UPI0016434747|nr:pentapeptide repeat-containing protein [Nocardioides sp. zg-1228]MBC2931787.1 pentapeptide repeat-containing protein [Nocardioides sp. zg-1228]QSF57364.1 pentapeptide repeat-containing protein [Nocardioides sp. zg-1228]
MATPGLSSDCSRCFALCCVLLPYSADAGFGADKAGGRPCLNLLEDDGCRIHATLREDGWPGCTVFECFGAGQQVSQVSYAGVSWREPGNPPHRLAEMGAVLTVMRQLHEMLAHLVEVARRSPDPAADAVRTEIEDLTGADPETILLADLDSLHDRVGRLLAEASARVRRPWPAGRDHTRADLAGQRVTGDHRGSTFRGALLIGADLRGADLRDADLLGADLRDADVRGCDLSSALFLTQPQVNAALGDVATTLPGGLSRPGQWGA